MLTCRARGSVCDSRCKCVPWLCAKSVSAIECPNDSSVATAAAIRHCVVHPPIIPNMQWNISSPRARCAMHLMPPLLNLQSCTPIISPSQPSNLHPSSIIPPHPSGSSSRGRYTSIAHRFGFGGVAYHFDGISVSSKGGEVVEGRRWAWELLHCYSV